MFSKSIPENRDRFAEWRMMVVWRMIKLDGQTSCECRVRYYPVSISPVSSLSSRKNFWLKMKATPLISSTLASAVVFLLTKLAVMAMANFPRNSLRLKPAEQEHKHSGQCFCPVLTQGGSFLIWPDITVVSAAAVLILIENLRYSKYFLYLIICSDSAARLSRADKRSQAVKPHVHKVLMRNIKLSVWSVSTGNASPRDWKQLS